MSIVPEPDDPLTETFAEVTPNVPSLIFIVNEFEVDIDYLTRCQEQRPELADEYLDLMLEEAKLKSKLDKMSA